MSIINKIKNKLKKEVASIKTGKPTNHYYNNIPDYRINQN